MMVRFDLTRSMIRRTLLIAVPLLFLAAVLLPLVLLPLFQPQFTTRLGPAMHAPVPDVAVAQERADPAVQRTDAATAQDAAAIPADAKWVPVLVVVEGTGEPVPGVDVAWCDETSYRRIEALPAEEQQALREDPERLARTFGWQAHTDQQGMVRVHVGSSFTMVYSRQGTRFGSVTCRSDAEPPAGGYRIELRDDRTLAVLVLDSDGKPAVGVPLIMGRCRADGSLFHSVGFTMPSTAAPDGVSRLRHVQAMRWSVQTAAPEAGDQWRVRMDIPGLDDPGAAFEPGAPPVEPIVLRLPPTGSVVARVTWHGQVLPAKWLGINVAGLERDVVGSAWGQFPGPEFHFPWLPLDRRWVALANNGPSMIQQEFDGPSRPNRLIHLDVKIPDDDVVVTARCIDEGGRPFANTMFRLEYEFEQAAGGTSLTTDDAGRFLWFAGNAREYAARLRKAAFTLYRDKTPLITSIPARSLSNGVNDLGDLQFTRGPLVVSGRFLCQSASAPRRAKFLIERPAPDPQQQSWETLEGLILSFPTENTFEVRGETLPVRHRLRFPARDHLPIAPIEFMPGARDVEIRIVAGSDLSANVLLAEDLPVGLFAVLVPEGAGWPVADEPDLNQRYRAYVMHRHAILRWQQLPPGSYTLQFVVRGWTALLLAIAHVAVPPPDGGDPRLHDIDLLQKVAVLTLRVVDRDGQPFDEHLTAEMAAFPQPQDPGGEWPGYHIGENGVMRMPVPNRPVDLLVVRVGLAPKQWSGLPGEVEVRLEPWPELQLRFAGLPRLPAGVVLYATVQGPSNPAARYQLGGSSGELDHYLRVPRQPSRVRDGMASVPIGEGVHHLSLFLRQDGRTGRTLESVTPSEIVAGPAPLEIRVSAQELERAVAQLQGEQGK